MPLYRKDDIRRMAGASSTARSRAMGLTETLLEHRFTVPAAKEFAHQGLGRRLFILARCITRLFDLLPPEVKAVPEREVLLDATIHLQAFVFNAFGALDDLAFIWVYEKQVKKANGHPLPNGRIGLTKDKAEVRGSLPPDLQEYLISIDSWFSHIESYRHALAHRIPLYIPPFIIRPEDADRYQMLDAQAHEAIFHRRDIEEHRRIAAERDALRVFRPWMKHSFNDTTSPIPFHRQVLADFATVEELTRRMISII